MAAALLAWPLTGCSGGGTDAHAPHPSPSNAGACNDLPLIGPDGGIVLGTDWSDEQHAYDDPVVLRACATAGAGGRIRVVASGPGITVRPAAVRVDPSGNGVVPFRVTVAAGAAGGLRVQQDGGGVGGDAPGPDIVADGDGWHFAPAG
jgi:hypothetical protein